MVHLFIVNILLYYHKVRRGLLTRLLQLSLTISEYLLSILIISPVFDMYLLKLY